MSLLWSGPAPEVGCGSWKDRREEMMVDSLMSWLWLSDYTETMRIHIENSLSNGCCHLVSHYSAVTFHTFL